MVLLALANWALLSHAGNVAEASEDTNAESDCNLAAAGLPPVADVPRGLHRLVNFTYVQLSSMRRMTDVGNKDVGCFRLLHSVSDCNGNRERLRG